MTDSTRPVGPGSVPELVGLLVRSIAPRRPPAVEPSHRLVGDLGYHSLALAELGFTLEDLFGLDPLPSEKAVPLQTLGDVSDLIVEELGADAGRLPDGDRAAAVLARYGVDWTAAA